LTFNFKNIQKILIPTDGSDYSIRAAEYGMDIAKMFDAQIMVVYVIDDVVLGQISKGGDREKAEMELKQDGQRYINYVVSLAEKECLKNGSYIAKGIPFEQIVNLAKELNVDLIIMGTYGRKGTQRILMGSVAEKVIEYSLCPVLVIK